MACRGVFFAITADDAAALQGAADDDALMILVEAIEEVWDRDNLAECDKSWDAMHRLLTDGILQFGNGPEPLRHCVLGPNQLHDADDYIVSLVPPVKVKEVAVALGLSVKTAETHRSNLMRKLDVHSVSQLVLYAVRNNIVQVVAPPSEHL